MPSLGVAAIQMAAEKSGNLALAEQEIREVSKRFPWVRLVVLGELVINGANPGLAEPAGGETETCLQALAAETGLWIVPGSLYEQRGDAIYNTTPVIDSTGTIIARYDKLYPFLPYEKNITPGCDFVVFDIPGGGRVGVAICYDMWFPEVIRTLTAMGAETIVLPTLTNTIDRDVEIAIARANAAVNQCFFIDINVGGNLGVGRSAVFGPGGELICEAGSGREIIALDLDIGQVHRARKRGWHGLGQVMKSFRDGRVSYPFHSDPEARWNAMHNLGPLEMPGSGEET